MIRFDSYTPRPRRRDTRCRHGGTAPFEGVRLLFLLCGVGIWQAAASLGAPLLVTMLLTAAAAALGLWALAVLRDG
jgi:hypothetical protein